MVEKKVAIALMIIALVLVIVAAYSFITQEKEIKNINNELEAENQNGKIGVEIIAPAVEDKGNGN